MIKQVGRSQGCSLGSPQLWVGLSSCGIVTARRREAEKPPSQGAAPASGDPLVLTTFQAVEIFSMETRRRQRIGWGVILLEHPGEKLFT